MALVKVLVLCGLVLTTNGCTVLGIAADLAILSAADNNERGPLHRNGIEPFFTQKGIKHDIELVKNLMAKLPENELKPVSKEDNQRPILACKNQIDGKQQCHPPEYYEDMYIKDTSQEEEPQLSKD